jgi:phenylacetate-CoA ligase
MGQLYCSAYHLAPDLVPAYLEAFERHGVRHLYGYGSALEALARSLDEAGLGDRARALGLAVAVSNAEPLFDHQRQLIGRVLGCPVRETYGMAELVAAGSECEHGRLHLWPEVGVVELLDPASGRCSDPWELGEGESLEGELVCTGLLNRVQPLVRYRVGDRARLRGGGCPCGRGLPILEKVEGRVDDGIRTPDGRSIGRLDPVFKDGLPIREAQIIQEQPDSVRLLVVPTPEFGTEDGEDLKRRLAQRIGAMEIHLETVSSIPRSAAGKRPLVINRLGTGEVAP